jgi:hypothetical protein
MEAIDQIKDRAEDMFENASEYLEARWNLGVLHASSKAADIISTLITTLVMAMIGLIILIFLSVGAALLIGEQLNKPSSGFFYVGIFYVIMGIIMYANKDNSIKLPIINSFIKKFYHEE